MFDVNFIVSDSDLTLDFVHESDDKLRAVDRLTGEVRGYVTINGCTFDASSSDIFMQYKLWLTRPERSVGKVVPIEDSSLAELQESYEEILVGAYILSTCSAYVPVSIVKPNYIQMITWLRSTDFFTAPASTQHHDSYMGGLLVHSLKVYNAVLDLMKTTAFSKVSLAEAVIGSLTHDWCKIGYYEVYSKNVKNQTTGNWDKVDAYRVNPKGITLGHGVTSLYLASKCFNLSPELAAAIRWHMSEYNVADNEMNELHNCNSKYPICHLLQFADRLACSECTQKNYV